MNVYTPSAPNLRPVRFGHLSVWLAAAVCLLVATPALRSHVAWPTFYSARTEVAIAGDELRVAVTIEIPILDLVMAFNRHFADRDLIDEIDRGRLDELEKEFRQVQFRELAKGLGLTIDGLAAPGEWRAADTPINGRSSEGFFTYVLEFDFTEPPQLVDPLPLVAHNELFPEVDIVFASLVDVGEPWRLVEASVPQPPPDADLTLGSPEEMALWSERQERRRFRVVVTRAP